MAGPQQPEPADEDDEFRSFAWVLGDLDGE